MQIKAFGTNYDETVTIAQVPVPEPGPGEALVRINCRPVNPSDVFAVTGVYPGFVPKDFPAVPGLEGASCLSSEYWVGNRPSQWSGALSTVGPQGTVNTACAGTQGPDCPS